MDSYHHIIHCSCLAKQALIYTYKQERSHISCVDSLGNHIAVASLAAINLYVSYIFHEKNVVAEKKLLRVSISCSYCRLLSVWYIELCMWSRKAEDVRIISF